MTAKTAQAVLSRVHVNLSDFLFTLLNDGTVQNLNTVNILTESNEFCKYVRERHVLT